MKYYTFAMKSNRKKNPVVIPVIKWKRKTEKWKINSFLWFILNTRTLGWRGWGAKFLVGPCLSARLELTAEPIHSCCSSCLTHRVAGRIHFPWAVGLRLQILMNCWQEPPSVLCHVGLSTEHPSTWKLALFKQARKRARGSVSKTEYCQYTSHSNLIL